MFKFTQCVATALNDISYSLTRIADELSNIHSASAILKKLEEIQKIMANDKAAVMAQLSAIKTEVGKLGTDLAAFVADLKAQIAAGGDLTDLVAEADDIAASLQAVDDSIPERPEPTA